MSAHILSVLVASTPVFLIVFVGVFLRTRKIVTDEVDSGLTKLVLNVLLPCFIFHNILGSEAASNLPNVLLIASIGTGIVVLSLAVVYRIAPLLGMQENTGRRSFTVATALQNYGFIPVPLIISLYPDKELLPTLFLHSLGVELAIYTVAVMVFSHHLKLSPKLLLKGPIMAVFLGVLLNVTHLTDSVPAPMLKAMAGLGTAAVPISLLAVGMSIGRILPEAKFSFKVSAASSLIRLGLLPALIIGIAYLLPIEDDIKRVLLVQSAMPAAMFPIVLARHYGGKPALVAEVAITTSVLSFLTMPIIIVVGTALLGL